MAKLKPRGSLGLAHDVHKVHEQHRCVQMQGTVCISESACTDAGVCADTGGSVVFFLFSLFFCTRKNSSFPLPVMMLPRLKFLLDFTK